MHVALGERPEHPGFVDVAVDEAKGGAEGRLGTVVIGFETGTTCTSDYS